MASASPTAQSDQVDRARWHDATNTFYVDGYSHPSRTAGGVYCRKLSRRMSHISSAPSAIRRTVCHLAVTIMNTPKLKSALKRNAPDGFIVVAVLWILGALS